MDELFAEAEASRAELEACEVFWAEVLHADPAYLEWRESLENFDE